MKVKTTLTLFFYLAALSLSPAACFAMGEHPSHPPRYVRVAVLRGAKELSLKIRGPFQIRMLHTNDLLVEDRSLRSAKVRPCPSGIKIGGRILKVYGVNVRIKKKGGLYINRRRFRGSIDIIREANQTLLVINELDVEDYINGVMRGEVSHRWPIEALKAQAVACRTFALYQSEICAKKDYDLTSDTYSQIYGGKSSERYRTNRAVRQTIGEVLTYKGKIFPTYYHATCGGHTEDASKLWDTDLEPLKGRKDPFCRKSPHYHWKSKVNLRKLEEKLRDRGYSTSRILAIIPKSRDKSGRIEELEIHHADGKTEIDANKFRLMVGPKLVRSTNFIAKIKGREAIFYGVGWGHGVGLCQWGAYFMARKGYNYKEILNYYYPGTKTQIIYEEVETLDLKEKNKP